MWFLATVEVVRNPKKKITFGAKSINGSGGIYPLVNVYIAIENGHLYHV
jgi:hypothetical protein